MLHLLAARRAGRHEDGIRRHRPRRRQQLALADLPRHLVVLLRVAERSGHAAAAGVEIDDRARRDARQQRARRRQQAHRLLMTVTVQQHGRRPGSQRRARARPACPFLLDVLLEQHARVADHPRLALRLAAQQRRRVLADRRQAARLEEQDRLAARRRRRTARRRSPAAAARASSSRPCEISGRPQQPCGASRTPTPAALEHVGRRDADLRVVVVGEGVVEQDHAVRAAGWGWRLRAAAASLAKRRANVVRAKAGGVRRRSMPSSCSFDPAAGALPRDEVRRAARTRLPPFRQPCDVADHARLQRRAVPLPVAGEELALEARDVDADRALGLAGAALEAEVEHLVHAVDRRAPPRPAVPAIASRSTFARPRVECFSSRVAMYDGHIVPSSVLRQAPRPLHISTARPMPPCSA